MFVRCAEKMNSYEAEKKCNVMEANAQRWKQSNPKYLLFWYGDNLVDPAENEKKEKEHVVKVVYAWRSFVWKII